MCQAPKGRLVLGTVYVCVTSGLATLYSHASGCMGVRLRAPFRRNIDNLVFHGAKRVSFNSYHR